jgi:hypothetical protein
MGLSLVYGDLVDIENDFIPLILAVNTICLYEWFMNLLC